MTLIEPFLPIHLLGGRHILPDVPWTGIWQGPARALRSGAEDPREVRPGRLDRLGCSNRGKGGPNPGGRSHATRNPPCPPRGVPGVAGNEADTFGWQAGRLRPELVHRGIWLEAASGVDRQGVIDGQAGPPRHGIKCRRGRVGQDPGSRPAVAESFERARDLGTDRQIPERPAVRATAAGSALAPISRSTFSSASSVTWSKSTHRCIAVRSHEARAAEPASASPVRRPDRVRCPRTRRRAAGARAGSRTGRTGPRRPGGRDLPSHLDPGLELLQRPPRLLDRALVLDRADVTRIEIERYGLQDAA